MESGYLYETIVSDLIYKIESGEYQKGAKLPTEAELVEQYKVSRTTVIKAINDLKKQGYVIRYPKKGTFVVGTGSGSSAPAPAPVDRRSLVARLTPENTTRWDNIDFIIPTASDIYALNLVKGISAVFPKDKYRLNLIQSYDENSEESILADVMERGSAGIILFPVDHPIYSDAILYIRLSGFPLVLVDRMMDKINLDFVVGDNRQGGRLVAEHLYALGHRKVAFITSAEVLPSSVRDRIRGMRNYFVEQGLPAGTITVYDSFSSDEYPEEQWEMISEALKENTALVFSESGYALTGYSMLREHGYDIPGDVSFVSFDNPTCSVSPFDVFTYIDQAEQEMGRKAAEILYNRINHISGEARQIVIAPKLHVGSTTGAPGKAR